MDEGDFIGGNPLCHEFLLHVVIHGELAGRHGDDLIHIDDTGKSVVPVILGHVFLFRRFADKRAVHVDKRPGFQILPFALSGCRSLSSLGCGQITKDKLRSLVIGCIAPDVVYPRDSRIELGTFIIIGVRRYKPEIQPGLAGVIGDFERIVDARVWRKILHALDDLVHIRGLSRGTFHHIIIRFAAFNRRRQGPFPGLLRLFVQIVFCHDIGKSSVHGKQLRHVLKLGKTAF